MRFGSVCSGIEAASVAWGPLGFEAAWFAEIEAFPCSVLAHHYPAVPNMGDMTQLAPLVRAGLLEAPDVLVGGTPCQAFSIAGARAGLLDPRGQLTLSFADLANAIDEQRPGDECVIVWENVPGVLSDKSNAFGCFLGILAGEDEQLVAPGDKWPNAGVVVGPQRAIAWRVLDAQYFGVAQRRRRVFVAASARKGFDPTEILFEFDGVRRGTAPSRETRQDVAGTITSSLGKRGGQPDCGSTSGQLQPVTCMAHGQGGAEVSVGDRPTLTCNHEAPIIAFDARQNTISSTDVFGALGSSSPQAQAVCVTSSITHTLKAEGFDASEDGTGRGQPIVAAFAENSRAEIRLEGGDGSRTGALSTGGGGKPGQGTPMVLAGMAVRRLTPRECERLQAFSDDYTLVPHRGKPAADGPRYKALGNSMCTSNMRWIGKRLLTSSSITA